MTKEEFMKMAMQHSFAIMPCVYKLSVRLRGPGSAYEKNHLDEWENDLLCIERHYFSKLANAEDFIRDMVSTNPGRLHSAIVKRIPLDHGKGDLPVNWWLYDSNGQCVDNSVCSAYHKDSKARIGRYWGRRPSKIRFKKGDIVEVLRYDREHDLHVGTLAVIQKTPSTIEEEWEYFDSNQKSMGEYPFGKLFPNLGYFHDYTDDCYGYLTGFFGDTAMPCVISEPTLPVPPEVEQELRDYAASHAAWLRAAKNPALTPEELKEMQKINLNNEEHDKI